MSMVLYALNSFDKDILVISSICWYHGLCCILVLFQLSLSMCSHWELILIYILFSFLTIALISFNVDEVNKLVENFYEGESCERKARYLMIKQTTLFQPKHYWRPKTKQRSFLEKMLTMNWVLKFIKITQLKILLLNWK